MSVLLDKIALPVGRLYSPLQRDINTYRREGIVSVGISQT
jgi:hypothetical protein